MYEYEKDEWRVFVGIYLMTFVFLVASVHYFGLAVSVGWFILSSLGFVVVGGVWKASGKTTQRLLEPEAMERLIDETVANGELMKASYLKCCRIVDEEYAP